ncbi:MAG: hypothetical protein UY41_C0035G0002 [Candidatus Moranbacteria bacterium GW2011_GWE1_49_15]|nr:MAG: hypothetical protein UX75_C0053G0002 [Candidatus Moranbacteria bacterium GW2011_GWE2_47_10]KKW06091.1 MAG: hypothetical protein UY41_C0035G0002 [Candidatus Moranbacteria bacterium GW2011_GWE1_49_15]HBP00726.1 hypothetical protein [Candidatus Moranbacteria bacterium]
MKKETEDKKIKEKIEEFLYSDSAAATTTKFVLAFLAVGTVVFGAALIPGLIKALDSFSDTGPKKRNFSKKKVANVVYDLKRRKLIEIIKDKDGKIKVELTNRGKKRLVEYSIGSLRIKKPKKWDGKWRVLIFDIPTEPKIYAQAREALRSKIKDLGFHQLQKSVWVHPYDCEDELLFIAELYNVQKYIEILTVEKLLHEKDLKNKFRLKS